MFVVVVFVHNDFYVKGPFDTRDIARDWVSKNVFMTKWDIKPLSQP